MTTFDKLFIAGLVALALSYVVVGIEHKFCVDIFFGIPDGCLDLEHD